MDRNTFLKCVCSLGACGCVADLLGATDAAAADEAKVPDQRLEFAQYQVANLVRFMAAGPAVPACTEAIEQTGRECAKLGGLGPKLKGNPERYFEVARKAWGTEFQWDKAKGVITVTGKEGPCGCPLVDDKLTPSFWCNCSVGYQKELFSAVFDRPVKATLKASKLAGAKQCVFEVEVGT
jgi:hypothetical protein